MRWLWRRPSQRLTQALVAEKQREMITAGIYGDVEGPDDEPEEWARYFGAVLGEPTRELYRKSALQHGIVLTNATELLTRKGVDAFGTVALQ